MKTKGTTETKYYSEPGELEGLLDNLVEYRYQLRIEHNHRDMKWYAYYAGKDNRQLFDKDTDWMCGGNTPLEAVQNLIKLKEQTAHRGEL